MKVLSSRYLNSRGKMNSLHHSFDIDLATLYGVQEAVLIHHFQHWIRINQKRKVNQIEGRTWTYQTVQDIVDHFPYWTFDQVTELLHRLCKGQNRKSKKNEKDFEPVLVKSRLSKNPFDSTCWYAFVNEERFLNNVYGKGNPFLIEGASLSQKTGYPFPYNKGEDTIKDTERERESTPAPQPLPQFIPSLPEPIAECIPEVVAEPKAEPKAELVVESKFNPVAERFLISFGDHVKLTQPEYHTLCQDHGEPKIQEKIDVMNDRISSTGLKPYKNYAAALRNWIREDDKKETAKLPAKIEGSKQDTKNKELAESIKQRYPKNSDILLGNEYIEFVAGQQCIIVKFSDHRFTEIVQKEMLKRKLVYNEK